MTFQLDNHRASGCQQTNRQMQGEGVVCSLTLQLADRWREAFLLQTLRQTGRGPHSHCARLYIWKQLVLMGTLARLLLYGAAQFC